MAWTLLGGFIAGIVVGIIIMGLMAARRIDEVKAESRMYWEGIMMNVTDQWDEPVSIKEWMEKGEKDE